MTDFFESFFASTIEAYEKELVDNYFDENAVLKSIKQNSKVRTIGSGRKIKVPVQLGKANGAKAYTFYDEFDMSPSGGFEQGAMPFAHLAVPVIVSDHEVDENTGEAEIFDIVAAKVSQSEDTLTALINAQMFIANASNDAGKGLYGFPDMIEELATPTTTYMEISPTTETAWRNKYKATAIGNLVKSMGQLFRALKDGQVAPNLIVTTDLGEESYETVLTAPMSSTTGINIGTRFGNTKEGDAGYGSLVYKGIPIVLDKAAIDYTASTYPRYHFLNTKFIGFLMNSVQSTGFIRATKQLAKSAFVKSKAQLFTNNRRRQGTLNVTS